MVTTVGLAMEERGLEQVRAGPSPQTGSDVIPFLKLVPFGFVPQR